MTIRLLRNPHRRAAACRLLLMLSMLTAPVVSLAVEGLKPFPPDPHTHARLDWSKRLPVRELPIFHQDFTLRLDSGHFVPFRAMTTEAASSPVGGMFIGHGRIQFYPVIPMETAQLRRFFGTDSLNRQLTAAVVFADERILGQIKSAGSALPEQLRPSPPPIDSSAADSLLRELLDRIASPERTSLVHELLANRLQPMAERYLSVSALTAGEQLVGYRFNPHESEEIQLLRETTLPGGFRGMELVSRYSMFVDVGYFLLNGIRKPLIEPVSYTIDAKIVGKDPILSLTSTLRAIVQQPNAALIALRLASQYEVRHAVVNGQPVATFHDSATTMKERDILVLLPEGISFGDTISITLSTTGRLTGSDPKRDLIDPASIWYPRFGYSEPATFEVSFQSPARRDLFLSASLSSEKIADGIRHTRWLQNEPVPHLSFSYGDFKLIKPLQGESPPITVAYVPRMHRSFLPAEVPADEGAVARDLRSAMRFFSEWFGSYPFPALTVTELPAWHGRSYAGLLQLAHQTFVGDDKDGQNELFRAHELAHQWWGTSLWLASYHDEWLSEGFAEYSALLHLRHRRGDDMFAAFLQRFHRDIVHVHAYYRQRGSTAAPIALGYRAGSSLDPDAHDLIVYRKGAFVLHMIRMMLLDLRTGDDSRFFALMAEFFQRYKGKRVNSRDFKFMAEKYVGIDLTPFFDQYVYGSSLPTYRVTTTIEPIPDAGWQLDLNILQEVDGPFEMWVPLLVETESKQYQLYRILVNRPEVTYSLTISGSKPKRVLFNPGFAVLADVEQEVVWKE